MLDCQTKKGKRYIHYENLTAEWIEDRSQGKTKLVKFDALTSCADRFAVSTTSGAKQALIEIKARNMNKDTFVNQFNSEYMISTHKVYKCKSIAEKHKIPFFIFVNLIKDNYILRIKAIDKNGNFSDHRIENRQTQNTCNGGTKYDDVFLFKVPTEMIISK